MSIIYIMKKSVPQRLNKKPLIALAIILFGTGIAYYTKASMNKREGLEGIKKLIEGIEAKGEIPSPADITLPDNIPLPPGTPANKKK